MSGDLAVKRVHSERNEALREMEFLCECGDRGCRERVRLTSEEYEHLRAKNLPLLAPGHPPRRHLRPLRP